MGVNKDQLIIFITVVLVGLVGTAIWIAFG
jgi:hypothetical protein